MLSRYVSALLSLVSICSLSIAQSNYPNQSEPFALVLTSANETLNGTSLTSCHSGAIIESLCIDTNDTPPSEYTTFYYNYTTLTTPSSYILTWREPYSDGSNQTQYLSEAMAFIYNPGSNVALPLFYPDEDLTTQIQFLEDGTLGIPVFTDDTVTPPTYEDVVITDRWFVCQTYFSAYTYYTLAWQLGSAPPQNPSCSAVTVKMVPVSSTYPTST